MSKQYYIHEYGRSMPLSELRQRIEYHTQMLRHCSAGSAQHKQQKKIIKDMKKVLA